ncbi:hypothetical protein [Halostagnicola larsenii]|uniref:hypothetical protein n=1 Tax=Halostagnicola larsenii TaxID=353800 RepID=UPI0012F716E9|nr:hypothetical protein [Halostagnicola larsenii]
MSTGKLVHRDSSPLKSPPALEDCPSHDPTAAGRTGSVAAGLFARAVVGGYGETGAAGESGDDGCLRSPDVRSVPSHPAAICNGFTQRLSATVSLTVL